MTAVKIGEVFGSEPTVKLMDGAEHLWTGSVRFSALDLPAGQSEEIWITFQFLRPLRPAEMSRLGLPSAAA